MVHSIVSVSSPSLDVADKESTGKKEPSLRRRLIGLRNQVFLGVWFTEEVHERRVDQSGEGRGHIGI
eukprot:138681-Pyramimonas_sp.AAC.1